MKSGDRVGKYVVLGKLAKGGMAEVWLARQGGPAGFHKMLVLKTIAGPMAEDPQFVQMFLEEARLAALLNHPNVVQIFDLDSNGDEHFIAMEYLDGRNVGHLQKSLRETNKMLPPGLAARIAADCCAGLDYAHALKDPTGKPLNIIHRDVTAENIIITYQGQVKLLDFGIAKAAEGSSRTQPGTVRGKLAYLAPEQVTGRTLDRRVDIWAMGVNLYVLLAGRNPFDGGSDLEFMRAIVEQQPLPPSVHNPMVPSALDAIVMRALEKDPSRRYDTAGQFRTLLEEFLRDRPPAGPFQLAELMESLYPAATDAARQKIRALVEADAANPNPDASSPSLRPVTATPAAVFNAGPGRVSPPVPAAVPAAVPAPAPVGFTPAPQARPAAPAAIAGLDHDPAIPDPTALGTGEFAALIEGSLAAKAAPAPLAPTTSSAFAPLGTPAKVLPSTLGGMPDTTIPNAPAPSAAALAADMDAAPDTTGPAFGQPPTLVTGAPGGATEPLSAAGLQPDVTDRLAAPSFGLPPEADVDLASVPPPAADAPASEAQAASPPPEPPAPAPESTVIVNRPATEATVITHVVPPRDEDASDAFFQGSTLPPEKAEEAFGGDPTLQDAKGKKPGRGALIGGVVAAAALVLIGIAVVGGGSGTSKPAGGEPVAAADPVPAQRPDEDKPEPRPNADLKTDVKPDNTGAQDKPAADPPVADKPAGEHAADAKPDEEKERAASLAAALSADLLEMEDDPEPAKPGKPRPPRPAVKTGVLVLASNVPAEVTFDGRKAGRTPLKKKVPVGDHQVVFTAIDGGSVKKLQVGVQENGTTEQSASFATGKLSVKAAPWAQVTVNGRAFGLTPLAPLTLPEGAHSVVLENKDLKVKKTLKVNIKAGGMEELKIRMTDP